MIRTEEQSEFETLVANFSASPVTNSQLEELARRAKAGERDAAMRVAVAISFVAAVYPGASMAVLDAITRGWLGAEAAALKTPAGQSAMLARLAGDTRPDSNYWDAFWAVAGASDMKGDDVTANVAALGAHLHPGYRDLAEAAAIAHPGTAGASTKALPAKLTLDILGAQPKGSLGHDFYSLIVDNDFNLEVLDREAIGLHDLPPALRYLNIRILQMHDVWHLVGGYRTTVLQEVGISSFQLAQFGHNYSALLISTAAASSAFNSAEAFGLIMQIIGEAWLHGRTTSSFMAIEWENEWHLPIEEIRARHGILPFTSAFPADLIEQLRPAA
jgi:ubiquinone biosynthesis protein Coq4